MIYNEDEKLSVMVNEWRMKCDERSGGSDLAGIGG